MADHRVQGPIGANVMVVGLPSTVKSSPKLKEMLAQYGEVISATVALNNKQVARNFGWVSYKTVEGARRAIEGSADATWTVRLNVEDEEAMFRATRAALLKAPEMIPETQADEGSVVDFLKMALAADVPAIVRGFTGRQQLDLNVLQTLPDGAILRNNTQTAPLNQLCKGESDKYMYLGEGGSAMEGESMRLIRQHQAAYQALKLDVLTDLTREVVPGKEILSNLFLSGTEGSLCRTHVDATHTFFLGLKGHRTWALAHPDHRKELGIKSCPGYNERLSPLDDANKKLKVRAFVQVLLKVGDLLLVPKNWVHQVRGDRLSLGVSCNVD